MERLIERFMRYCRIDTQSDEESTTYPSTAKQLNLSRMLVEELKEIGMQEVELDEHGYVMATLPANLPEGHKEIPVIGFISHVDTSPSVTGANVDPQWVDYEGGDIVLPKDPSQVIRVADYPMLKDYEGTPIITTDGTTLLGADDKAGIAEIMTAMEQLIQDKDALHGKVRVLFTPDEEIGRGVEFLDIEKLGVECAYTMDGSKLGEIENENFNAFGAQITIRGKNVHPGYAKDKMINALRVLSFLVTQFPEDMLPESTEGREGYVHPHEATACEEEASLHVLIRDFEREGVESKQVLLWEICARTEERFPGAEVTCTFKHSYDNMRFRLEERPEIVEYAMEAAKRVGVEPHLSSIRGGTDGAMMTAKGIPTPNIFTGAHAFHAKTEWAAVSTMRKSVETIIELVKIWAKRPDCFCYLERSREHASRYSATSQTTRCFVGHRSTREKYCIDA